MSDVPRELLVANNDFIVPVTVEAGQTISSIARLGGTGLSAIHAGSEIPDGTKIQIKASIDNGATFYRVFNVYGDDYTITVSDGGGIIIIGANYMQGVNAIRLSLIFPPSYVHDTDLTINLLSTVGGG